MERQVAPDLSGFAAKSYRYLRLAIVVLVASVLASVVIERIKATCWQDSVSSYYYTPVHSVFVAALVAIGVCLIAIRGATDVEDALLNLSGMLAPVVALVPTAPSSRNCPTATVGAFPEAYQRNNLLALLIGFVVAIVVTLVLLRVKRHRMARPNLSGRSLLVLILAVGVIVAGTVWYFAGRQSFLTHAHSTSAILMFAVVGVVIVIDARQASGAYRRVYAACAAAMAIGFAVILPIQLFASWHHAVLVLEVVETVPFVVFWLVQSIEHWEIGIPASA